MSNIQISDITSNDNTGVFDELMCAIETRINGQYDAGRIKGSDYATVYLGAMQSAISQSIQFVLGEQQADKQADLIAAQASKVAKDEDVVDQNILTAVQQTLKTTAETDLLTQKKFTEQAQILDTVDGNLVVGSVGKKNDLYDKQKDGYDRDAEQKLLSIMTQLWGISASTSQTPPPTFADTPIDTVATKAGAGIGVVLP